MRSHIDDGPFGDRVFSRDCPEYWFPFPPGSALAGEQLVVLVNHFKSKFGGNNPASIARRKRQSAQVADIYDGLRVAGVDHVVVLGDDRPGTFGNGTRSSKIDYLLLSPSLFARGPGAGIFRKGVWGGVNGTLFPTSTRSKPTTRQRPITRRSTLTSTSTRPQRRRSTPRRSRLPARRPRGR